MAQKREIGAEMENWRGIQRQKHRRKKLGEKNNNFQDDLFLISFLKIARSFYDVNCELVSWYKGFENTKKILGGHPEDLKTVVQIYMKISAKIFRHQI